MHHLSLLSIYTYLKLFYNHPFNHLFSLYLSFYRSILSYPILSCPTYPTYPTGFFRKKTAILLQVVTSHLIPPRPLDQC